MTFDPPFGGNVAKPMFMQTAFHCKVTVAPIVGGVTRKCQRYYREIDEQVKAGWAVLLCSFTLLLTPSYADLRYRMLIQVKES